MNHARLAAKNLRIEDLPLLVPPHPLYDLTPEQVREVARIAYPVIIKQLTSSEALPRIERIDYVRPTGSDRQLPETSHRESESMKYEQPDAHVLEMEDSWELINAWFLERNMTDGLPIVPPTEIRVRSMTDYAEKTLGWLASDVIATLAPKRGMATVERIGANAVMAGCKPEYMPVLISCVQAISDPKFNLDAVQTATHITSLLPIVNGPMRKAIDLNHGYNTVGSRWHSTATIGRALRLILANIGGIPGSINIHTQGHIGRYEHCMAENEEENPWEPLHVERGFPRETSTVTVFPACPAAMIDERGGSQNARDLLKVLALSIPYVGNRNTNGEGQPLLTLCPQHARTLAEGGYSKEDVKRFIWERGRLRFGDIPPGVLGSLSKTLQKFYADVDPDYGIPIAEKPEDIAIVVMGGKGTHSLSVQTPLHCSNVTVQIARKDGSPLLLET